MNESLLSPPARTVDRPSRRGRTTGFHVRVRSLSEVDEKFTQQWHELEAHSEIRNPFVSSSYVLAAAKHLPGLSAPLILTIEKQGVLQGLGVFQCVSGSRRLPVKHLRAWQTPHTYYDALLLREENSQQTMQEFWNFFLRGRHDWHGVEFPRFPNRDPVSKLFDDSALAADIGCRRGTCWERASLGMHEPSSDSFLQHLSIKRAKSLRRGWRALEKHGPVRFEFQRDRDQIHHCADELIELEDLGWKSQCGTSLASQSAHTKFFREMISGLNEQGNVFFSRVLIGDRAVASVVNLQAGDVAYAFKLGWDPAFERGCPGFQLKVQTAEHARDRLPGIQLIDSCSSPGSFIESVWPHRRSFCMRTYLTSPVGSLASSMVQGLRWVRNNAVTVSRHFFHADNDRSVT